MKKDKTLISVNGLSRFYGKKRAIENISFDVCQGEILGLLGPNGAGKSTTMQIICGVIAANNGSVNIAEYDIHDAPKQAKQNIGFLPEQLPLYHDLNIDEYLLYSAKLRGVKKANLGNALSSCKKRCGLKNMGSHLIQNISKGFKQRVGIAQAIIHAPSIIILDEPTSGLDPKQILDIRTLMRELSKDHSIILSTHILSEVEAICDRVLIINKGNIVLDQYLNKLLTSNNSLESVFLDLTGGNSS
jgi:ABC-2 type transport system ATP-binding protein